MKQHGFIEGRSTITNLLEQTDFIAKQLQKRSQIDIFYADMSKAFDKVDHKILINKLVSFGITGRLLNWFESYLQSRPVTIIFNGAKSRKFIQTSGVPQGSILGPLLFVIYVNDIVNQIDCGKMLYADDLKMNSVIRSSDDAKRLQDDINKIKEWCNLNKLQLNYDKCFIMTVSNKIQNIEFAYSVDNIVLSKTHTFRDLGVTYDTKLKFSAHIDSIVKKSAKMLGFLMRTAKHLQNFDSLMLLYKSLVRSNLEYATQIWSPSADIYIQAIEKVQRRFTRFMYRKFQIPYQDYEQRLKTLNLETLAIRRKYADLVLLYKIVNGTSCISNITMRRNKYSIRNMNLFEVQNYDIESAKNSPMPRMLLTYNDLFHNQNYFNLTIFQYKNLMKRALYNQT